MSAIGAGQMNLPAIPVPIHTARYGHGLEARPVTTPWGQCWEVYRNRKLLAVTRKIDDDYVIWANHARMDELGLSSISEAPKFDVALVIIDQANPI